MNRIIKDSLVNSTQGAMAMMLQKVKVYELAKELGMDSITLLDKLKRLEIDVKNHMSSLGSEEVKLVRDSIAKEQALLTKATKATKKREEEPTVQKRVGTTVIRRRAKSSGEDAGHPQSSGIEVTTSHPSEPEETYSEPQMTEAEPEKLSTMEAPEKVASHEPEAVVSAPVVPPTPVLRTPQETPAAAPAATTTTTPTAPARPRSTIIVTERAADRKAAEAAAAAKVAASRPAPLVRPRVPGAPMPTGSGLKIPSLLGARSAGLPIPRTSGILNIVKDDPRRSQPSRPGMGRGPHPGLPGQRPGQGIVNIGKEAIDRMVEEEQNFKKKGAAGKGEKDKDPLDVKVSDYRAKKELVFLPKKKKVPLHKEIRQTQITTPAAHKRVIKFVNTISVSELAQSMGIKSGEIIKKLIGMGVMANINHSLDFDTATLIANEYDYEVENVAFKEETLIPQVQDKPEDLQHRPPIVTVMGHVDHGKTSLLDAIRSENVAGGEAGGITQHIGAYTVDLNGKKITFIDTPGHEAFTVMRARGANVTDLVILVVAADDGVMPQTREAVDHARAANVPIIVAVNKIDKPGANPDKVMKGLAELNLLSEAWGGENIFVNVSAVKRTGIQELLESILLQAEMLDLKANPDRPGEGTVLEARLERSRGAVVNLLVKKGTVKIGDAIVAGSFCGKVRALTDDKGRQMKEIGPGYAAELLGLEGVPVAGDQFNVMGSDAEARDIAEHRHEKMRSADAAKSSKMSLEDLFSKVQQGNLKELPLVLKSDVFGSTEAIKESLAKLSTEKVKVKVISAGTGGISESDVMLASASNAIIIGFNVRPETKARALAEGESVEIKCYSIIYELLDDVKKAMAGLLDKKAVEKYLGRAEVRELFSVPKIGTVAGTSVVDGKITRGAQVRLLRDNRVIYTGKLSSLRRFKDDAKEVVQGYECGIGIENFNDLKQGDIIEAFMIEMVAQELDAPIASTESARA